MLNIKTSLSRFKKSSKSKATNIKKKVQTSLQKFKENVAEAKSKPRSKKKSLFLGFTTVVGIFGITLLTPVVAAVAKDLPKNTPKPGEVCPAPSGGKPGLVPSQQITNTIAGAAATICALAVSSGSFVIGALCGVIVVVGVLKTQGK